jgi:hypothetical protein
MARRVGLNVMEPGLPRFFRGLWRYLRRRIVDAVEDLRREGTVRYEPIGSISMPTRCLGEKFRDWIGTENALGPQCPSEKLLHDMNRM